MLLVALLWGSNFPAVKATIEAGLPGSAAAASRFTVAALALSPLLRGPTPLPPELVRGGLECGAWLALGYTGQSLALQHMPAGAVAFLASLQVVFVPLVQTFQGKSFTPRLALAAALCLSGVGLLESGGSATLATAEGAAMSTYVASSLLALLQPIGFGTSYLRIEALMRAFPSNGLQLSALQLLSNAAIALVWLGLDATVLNPEDFDFAGGGVFDMFTTPAVCGVLYTGLISTALTVLLQTKALGQIPATDSSVIVATEPLWAAGFAALLLGEQLDPEAQLGGALILGACVANSLFPADLGLGGGGADGSGAHGSEGAEQHDVGRESPSIEAYDAGAEGEE